MSRELGPDVSNDLADRLDIFASNVDDQLTRGEAELLEIVSARLRANERDAADGLAALENMPLEIDQVEPWRIALDAFRRIAGGTDG